MDRPESGAADRSRPIYPYPFTASYTGSGSVDNAKTFKEGMAETYLRSKTRLAGLILLHPAL